MNSTVEKSKCTYMDASKKEIFDLSINDIDYNFIYDQISLSLKSKKKLIINYANANSIRLIKNNLNLKKALLEADLVHSDGIGIWAASHLLKNSNLKHRFNFTDCSIKFLKDCEKNEWSLFILGGTDKLLSLAKEKIKKGFPNLNIAGTLDGYRDLQTDGCIKYINNKSPDILWVGMGTPKQELWIYENKDKLKCWVIQSVGDIITYFAGKKSRGPVVIRKLGFEWLIRFLRHPLKYFNRYLIGIPVFVYLLILEVYKKKNK